MSTNYRANKYPEPILEIQYPDGSISQKPIGTQDSFTIGRHPDTNCVLHSNNVSLMQLKITREDMDFYITNRSQTVDTYYRGELIRFNEKQGPLRHEQQIIFAGFKVTFKCDSYLPTHTMKKPTKTMPAKPTIQLVEPEKPYQSQKSRLQINMSTVILDGKAAELTAKGLQLIQLLKDSPYGCDKDRLLNVLFPDPDSAQPENNLRRLISKTNQILEKGWDKPTKSTKWIENKKGVGYKLTLESFF
jgi:hypothetical protein